MRTETWETAQFADVNSTPSQRSDLFINAQGYDTRSTLIMNELIQRGAYGDLIHLAFEDHQSHKLIDQQYLTPEIETRKTILCKRNHIEPFLSNIDAHIQRMLEHTTTLRVDIDYSSMPRKWYCHLATHLISKYEDKLQLRFWYAEGCYKTHEKKEYPTAGTDQFEIFSGGPSLDQNRNRIHLIGIGFDGLRTNAIRAVMDPSNLIGCYAYNPDTPYMIKGIKQKNGAFLDSCLFHFSMSVCDFSSMLSRLTEFVMEMSPLGDIILVPDGPKPLILAMSLLPMIFPLPGLSCFHISGSTTRPLDIKATGKIFGFTNRCLLTDQGLQ